MFILTTKTIRKKQANKHTNNKQTTPQSANTENQSQKMEEY